MSRPSPESSLKLTDAQRQVLSRATESPDGKVSMWYTNPRTMEILAQRGLIEKDRAARQPEERIKLESDRDEMIEKARAELSAGTWLVAYAALGLAQGYQSDLDSICWYVTDAGRAAVAP